MGKREYSILTIGFLALFFLSLYSDGKDYWGNFSFSLFTGYTAGLLTPFIVYLATGKTLKATISETISTYFRRYFSNFSPLRSFERENTQRSSFNTVLNSSIENSRSYCFVGETGIYVAPRIKTAQNKNDKLQAIDVILFLPNEDRMNENYSVFGCDIKCSLREAISISFDNLWSVAQEDKNRIIKVYISNTALGFRYELTDDSIFLTESSNRPNSTSFAESHQFSLDSIIGKTLVNSAFFLRSNLDSTVLNKISKVEFESWMTELGLSTDIDITTKNLLLGLYNEPA